MKKNISIILLGVAALCACTKKVAFSPDTATLHAGDSIQVSVKNAAATPKLLSENAFVASVGATTGWVKAKHVGETNICCDYDANSTAAENIAKCHVTVQPRYTYYTEPITDWKMTRAELVARLGNPTMEPGEMLVFGDIQKDEYIMVYYLIEDHIVQAYMAHKSLKMSEARAFLSERYAEVPEEDGSVYMNAESEDDATMYVTVEEGVAGSIGRLLLVTYTCADEDAVNSPAARACLRSVIGE